MAHSNKRCYFPLDLVAQLRVDDRTGVARPEGSARVGLWLGGFDI